MRELNAEFGASDASAMQKHAPDRVLVGIGVKAVAAMRDAAMPLDMRRLDHDQCRAAIGQHAEMRHVPVGR